MRRVRREDLPSRVVSYLASRQAAAEKAQRLGKLEIEKAWKGARRTQRIVSALSALQRMMGPRARCMYCVDSHGSDIDHFRPKASYPELAFQWANMLLSCTECGRMKGDRFPLAANGEPLLVDPSSEDPWDFLDFDPDTGNLTARYDPTVAAWSPKGHETVALLRLDRREAMAAGYKKTFRRLSTIVRRALDEGAPEPAALLEELRAADDHQILEWCFGPVGENVDPFLQLREAYPETWRAIASFLATGADPRA